MSETEPEAKILLSHYVDLTSTLVKNQARLVEECGYCISWTGDMLYYSSVQSFVDEVRYNLESESFNNIVECDISVKEAMERYGL